MYDIKDQPCKKKKKKIKKILVKNGIYWRIRTYITYTFGYMIFIQQPICLIKILWPEMDGKFFYGLLILFCLYFYYIYILSK